MKKIIKSLISVFAVAMLLMSLSSCSVFKTMRENALESSKKVILSSPDEKEVISELNKSVKASIEKSLSASEDISYSVNDISVLSGDEKAGLLSDSAKQIKNLIMAGKPGAASRDIKDNDIGLLSSLDNVNYISFEMNRNINVEKVTDEKGNAITNENGEEITTEYIGDNILHLVFNFFKTEVTETNIDENGDTQEITTVLGLEDSDIEKTFGEKADKETVLEEFKSVSEYINVKDYSISYSDCKISSDLSLDEGLVNFVKFDKNMIITADVSGTGVLEKYGDMTVTFKLTKTTNYSFTFAAEE